MTSTTKRLLEIVEDESGSSATAETALDSLGLDSLDYLSLILRIETSFHVDIPKQALLDFEAVGDIALWLEANPCA